MPNYQRTLFACNLAGFIQSATMNLSPYLFIPLSRLYGITYTQIGFLILINFVAQFAADIYFGQPVNKYGYRPFCVSSQLAIALGLILFASAPWIFPGNIFIVLVIATVIFSAATGLLEVILSPITKTIPAENSEVNFMLMHTSFAAGIFAAALFTTLLLHILGIKMWQLVVFIWALLPLTNAFLFLGAPLPEITPENQRMKIGELLQNKIFILSFFAIFFGAATELLIVQWGSTYLEKGLGLSKTVGDVGGMCLFAAMLGLARFLYAKKGAGLNLNNLMIYGSLACLVCYAVVAAAPAAWLVLAAFGLIGFFSSMLWTGTLIVASDSLPNTGAMIFALLAGGGDLGTAAIGQAVGWFSDRFAALAPAGVAAEQYGLKLAIALTIAVPLLSLVFQLLLKQVAPHRRVRS
ncbi:MAG: MFS transporter [Firmicutes bacterium]|nr:MFS transporter [Bacillota bacterium]